MSNKPKMKFKVIDGQIYSPADDLLNPEAIEEMLDHYFVLQGQLEDIKKFLLEEISFHQDGFIKDKKENLDTAFRSGIISQSRCVLNYLNKTAK